MSDNDGWRPAAPGGGRPPRPERPAFPAVPGPDPASEATPVRADFSGHAPPPPSQTADPVGMQSVLTRARDQSRFEAPVIEEKAERRPLSLKALLGGFLTVALVGMTIGFVYVNFIREVPEDPTVVPKVTATASATNLPSTPQEVVREYFTALADGDIGHALSLGVPAGQGLNTLLSPEAHATTRDASPIADLEVLTEDPLSTEVDVRYTLDGQPINTTVRLQRLDTGDYRLARTTSSVQLQLVGGQNLPVLVNDTPVDHDQALELVPGRYEVTSGLPHLAYPEDNSFTISTLASRDVQMMPVNPQLTETGRNAFMEAAKASLDRCLAQKTLTPTGCPFAMEAPGAINAGTIQWSTLSDPWEGVAPSLKSDDQSIAVMTLNIRTRVTFTYADGSTSGNNDQTWTAQVSANMLGSEADDVAVVWTR